MDPVSQTALMVAGAVTGAAGTLLSTQSQASSMEAQAAGNQRRAAAQSEWADRRADEVVAAAQGQAGQERRQATLAASRLGAIAGASGAGTSDQTVLNLRNKIAAEGELNAGRAMGAGQQQASGITYQAALDRWSADGNAAIMRAGAKSTRLGGYLGAAGDILKAGGGMAGKYPSPGASTPSTGYSSVYAPGYSSADWRNTSTRYY